MKKEFETLPSEEGDFMLDLSQKLLGRLRSNDNCCKSLEEQIEQLESGVHGWKIRCADQESELERVRHELSMWESLSLYNVSLRFSNISSPATAILSN